MRKKEAVHRRFASDIRAVILGTFCFCFPQRRQQIQEAYEAAESVRIQQQADAAVQGRKEEQQNEQKTKETSPKLATFRASLKPKYNHHSRNTAKVIDMSKYSSIDEYDDDYNDKLVAEEVCEVNFFGTQSLDEHNKQLNPHHHHQQLLVDTEINTSQPSVDGNSYSRVAPSIAP